MTTASRLAKALHTDPLRTPSTTMASALIHELEEKTAQYKETLAWAASDIDPLSRFASVGNDSLWVAVRTLNPDTLKQINKADQDAKDKQVTIKSPPDDILKKLRFVISSAALALLDFKEQAQKASTDDQKMMAEYLVLTKKPSTLPTNETETKRAQVGIIASLRTDFTIFIQALQAPEQQRKASLVREEAKHKKENGTESQKHTSEEDAAILLKKYFHDVPEATLQTKFNSKGKKRALPTTAAKLRKMFQEQKAALTLREIGEFLEKEQKEANCARKWARSETTKKLYATLLPIFNAIKAAKELDDAKEDLQREAQTLVTELNRWWDRPRG